MNILSALFIKRPLASLSLCTLLSVAAQGAAAQTADLLVLYTPQAMQTRNGGDIKARIASYVAYANQAYANSNVNLRLRLVGAEMLNAPYPDVTSQNLDRFRQDAQVAQLRRKYGADFVTLLNLRHATSGGYVCGIGYLPGGARAGGQLSSNASAVAYSLVGIDCGLSTLAHELGHNMGLGHSQLQNSNGSVFAWGRGYGVQGVFSDIMAYPQSFGTRNQLAIFSNPALRTCEGLACGVDRTRSDGADAAGNINLLAAQLANLMPAVTAVDGTGGSSGAGSSSSSSSSSSSGSSAPTTPPPCAKPAVAGNLVPNGEFNSLDGWRSAFGNAQLSSIALQGNGCVDNALAITQRSDRNSGAYHPLGQGLRANTGYRLSARLGIRGATREDVHMALYVRDNAGTRYEYLDPASVTSNELTAISRDFRLNADSNVGLLIYGAPAGVDIRADSISLTATGASQPTPPVPSPSDRTLVNEQFERTANGWRAYSSGTLSYSTTAAGGQYSLRTSQRASRISGPSLDLSGLLQSGANYQFRAAVYVPDAADNVQVWLYFSDNRGGQWQRLENTNVAANSWQTLSGAFGVNAEGVITQARITFVGPSRDRDLLLDNVVIERR